MSPFIFEQINPLLLLFTDAPGHSTIVDECPVIVAFLAEQVHHERFDGDEFPRSSDEAELIHLRADDLSSVLRWFTT